MADAVTLFLVDFFYLIGSNLILIICGLCGICRVKTQKGRWGWYTVGAILTLLSAIGNYAGIERRGDVYSETDILLLGSQAFFLILFFVLTYMAINAKHHTRAEKANPKNNGVTRLRMNANIACVSFWFLLFVELFVASTMIGAFFGVSSDVDTGSIIVLLALALLFAGGTLFLYRRYNPFKEKYYFVHETPLRFHKFFCYVSLPLGILLTIVSVFKVFSAEDFPSNSFYFIDLAYSFSAVALMCICFIGLRKWKSYAWRALMINYLLGIIYLVAVVVIHIIYSPLFLGSALTNLMIYIYIAAMICLYYYKRKALFLQPKLIKEQSNSCPAYPRKNAAVGDSTSPEKTLSTNNPQNGTFFAPAPIQFCRNCGHKLDENSNFCSQCGTSIIRNW